MVLSMNSSGHWMTGGLQKTAPRRHERNVNDQEPLALDNDVRGRPAILPNCLTG